MDTHSTGRAHTAVFALILLLIVAIGIGVGISLPTAPGGTQVDGGAP